MTKRALKYISVILSVTSLIALILPLFSARVTYGESWDMVIRGYNLIEFSAWGSIVLFVPIVLIGLMLSKLNNSIKNIGMLALFLFDVVALHKASNCAYNWVLQQTSEYVQIHRNQFLYIVLLFVAFVCFYIMCNFVEEGKGMNAKSIFLRGNISVEPVEFDKQNFFMCVSLHDFAKYAEDGKTVISKGNICFANDEGYFAALNDDGEEYLNIEALKEGTGVGFVMGTMPTGVYGRFYEDYDFRTDRDISILKYPEIDEGEADLYIPTPSGFTKDAVKISSISPNEIIVSEIDGLEVPPAIGALVMQGEELAAVVTDYDAENHQYKCISAHIMAIDLCRKIYEHKVFQQMQEHKLKR